MLKDFINLQGHERQGYVNNWGTRYQEATKSTIENFLHATLEQTLELKTYKDIKDLAKGVLTENWFSISYELTYQNDTFERMSDGKKAFVILKLLLEFSDKECPIPYLPSLLLNASVPPSKISHTCSRMPWELRTMSIVEFFNAVFSRLPEIY